MKWQGKVEVKDNSLIKVLQQLSKCRSSWTSLRRLGRKTSFAAVSLSISVGMRRKFYPVELQEVVGTIRVLNVDGTRKSNLQFLAVPPLSYWANPWTQIRISRETKREGDRNVNTLILKLLSSSKSVKCMQGLTGFGSWNFWNIMSFLKRYFRHWYFFMDQQGILFVGLNLFIHIELFHAYCYG